MYKLLYNCAQALPGADPFVSYPSRVEYFPSERDALRRARQLLDGEYENVVIFDESGNAVTGIPLQVKLGVWAD